MANIDQNWKNALVVIAKNTIVWLYQLSLKYNKQITRIDQIPSKELDELVSFGITGLWLIGIWERSPASNKIKTLYGREGTIASAYSIQEYKVADDLGGEEALDILKRKAHAHGIKIGCDIVPNHTGLDSDWLIEHPEWYIHSDENPFESWSYDTPDLSPEKSVSIQLEEGYYKRIKAAEVFRYTNNQTGKVSYIYHGNDGTSMPWNDTAQLNYLNSKVRTEMRNIIIQTAKRFDFIRLDAAMTLTKQHYKRLWFPTLDGSQYIPTRKAYAMSDEEFNTLMPEEFWHEIIADVEREAPDTLLIAEAFWLMEGYFIQNLGMHRVYNSAFMNMLKNEQNEKYKSCLRDMVAFEPGSLDHLVNYLTTPDEESAINQFGKGEKYFGTLTFAVAMPGLPLIGHGQLEGFHERYGMDYGIPQLGESPDLSLIAAHQERISPILKLRHHFAGSERFHLLEFTSSNGKINNDVLAFHNFVDNFESLVMFNNTEGISSGQLEFSPIDEDAMGVLTDLLSDESIQCKKERTGNFLIKLNLLPYQCRVFQLN